MYITKKTIFCLAPYFKEAEAGEGEALGAQVHGEEAGLQAVREALDEVQEGEQHHTTGEVRHGGVMAQSET